MWEPTAKRVLFTGLCYLHTYRYAVKYQSRPQTGQRDSGDQVLGPHTPRDPRVTIRARLENIPIDILSVG